MIFTPQSIPDVILFEPKVHGDERGYFAETFRQDVFDQATSFKVNFIQDNESSSSRGVLRGLHFQLPPHAQSKLVRVIKGAVLDVAVDIRQGSPTFGQHVAVELTEENKHQLFVFQMLHYHILLQAGMGAFRSVPMSPPACWRKCIAPGVTVISTPHWKSSAA